MSNFLSGSPGLATMMDSFSRQQSQSTYDHYHLMQAQQLRNAMASHAVSSNTVSCSPAEEQINKNLLLLEE